jgi:hypothetical protein
VTCGTCSDPTEAPPTTAAADFDERVLEALGFRKLSDGIGFVGAENEASIFAVPQEFSPTAQVTVGVVVEACGDSCRETGEVCLAFLVSQETKESQIFCTLLNNKVSALATEYLESNRWAYHSFFLSSSAPDVLPPPQDSNDAATTESGATSTNELTTDAHTSAPATEKSATTTEADCGDGFSEIASFRPASLSNEFLILKSKDKNLNNRDSCVSVCLETNECVGFAFREAVGSCIYFSSNDVNMKADSNWVYFKRNC